MTPLAQLLKEKIRTTGPLTVEEYMEACLYHPQHGYYTNGHNFL
ncbi:MAG: class I SAM-dependent methyltransferase, partial [Alphaproteobacteria bacterium]